MGKCKRRLLAKARNEKHQLNFTRQEALSTVVEELSQNPASISAKNIITLFGLTAEELAETGVTYEILRSLDYLICSFSP